MDHHNGVVRRQVKLSSGKIIDVWYYGDSESPSASRTDHESDVKVSDLKEPWLCRKCGSDLVIPLEWDEYGSLHWQVSLRCPSCEHTETGVFHNDLVDVFDEILDAGTESLVRALRQAIHTHMEEDVDRFAAALQSDLILPEDF